MYSYMRSADDIYTIYFNDNPVLIVFSRSTAERIVYILNSDFKQCISNNIDTLRF